MVGKETLDMEHAMNSITKFSLAALIAALPVTGYAQVDTTPGTTDSQRTRQMDSQRDSRSSTSTMDSRQRSDVNHKAGVRVSKYLGKAIYNHEDKKIGDIEDLVMDGGYNRISYAVLSFGGFMGMGEKYFAIPWSSLEQRPGQEDRLYLNVTKDQLKNAPGFDKNSWPNAADSTFRTQVDNHYGVRRDASGNDISRQGSSWQDRNSSNYQQNRSTDQRQSTREHDQDRLATGQQQTQTQQDQRRASGQQGTQTQQDQRTATGQQGTANQQDRSQATSEHDQDRLATQNQRQTTGSATGTTRTDRTTDSDVDRRRSMASSDSGVSGPTKDGLLWSRRVSQVIDADIKTTSNQNVGEIEDLIIEPASGRIIYAVIDLERDMRSAARYTAIPISKLTTDSQKEEFVLSMGRDELRNAPSFNSGQWPDWSDDQFRNRVDRLSDAQGVDSFGR